MNSFFEKESENMILQDITDKFNGTPLNTRNCVKSINSFLYFLSTSQMDKETLNSIMIFLLRSFQSKEMYLKHLVYSVILEISKYTDQGFIGINIILKDFTNSKFKYKILKSLFCIIPEEMINDFTKNLKEAFLNSDQNLVDSATIVTYLLLNKNYIKSKDLYKNLKISDDIHGYHTLALYHLSNKITDDKYYAFKNEAGIMSVRLATKSKRFDLFKNYLNLRISDTMVFFEACHQMSDIKEEYSIQYITLICQGLKNFLKNGNLYERFFSLQILSKLSSKFPLKVALLNKEIEELLQEPSKSLSMLAISILLKTGTEETIDRLIKYLPEFMSEMDDNYKKIGLNALYILTLKNTTKVNIFIDFIKKCILEKGNLTFKLFIVNLLKNLLDKEDLLDDILDIYVCYLEDSEHYEVSAEILGIMSQQIFKSKNYKKYLLHIYNRLILEDSKLKNAALQAIYDLSEKIKMDELVFYDCDDELVHNFYLYNFKNGIKNSNDELVGDLKDKVHKYLAEYNLEENIQVEEIKVKECREVLLTKETDDILVRLIKIIEGSIIKLEYKIENKYEDLEIKNGILSIKSNGQVDKIEFTNLLPGHSKIITKEINSEPDLKVFANLDYEICMVDDYSEVENESLPLLPFKITLFDLMKNIECDKGHFNKLIKFNLNCNLVEGSKKILDLVNLKVVLQNNHKNKNIIHFCGEYEDSGCFIECQIEFDKICRCSIEVWSDSEEILETVVRYFE